jgi:nitrile hydratase accessory protein
MSGNGLPSGPPVESNGSNDPIEAEQGFDAPWQARAFAVAVAVTQEEENSWDAFQERLAAEVERDAAGGTDRSTADEDPETIYYEQWLEALSRLLVESGILTSAEINARAREFADGERTAEEWIDGERDHAHGDGHEHDHAHDH